MSKESNKNTTNTITKPNKLTLPKRLSLRTKDFIETIVIINKPYFDVDITKDYTSFIYINKSFIKKIIKKLPLDRLFRKLYIKIKKAYKRSLRDKYKTTFKSFCLDLKTNLLFYKNLVGDEQLYILLKIL